MHTPWTDPLHGLSKYKYSVTLMPGGRQLAILWQFSGATRVLVDHTGSVQLMRLLLEQMRGLNANTLSYAHEFYCISTGHGS